MTNPDKRRLKHHFSLCIQAQAAFSCAKERVVLFSLSAGQNRDGVLLTLCKQGKVFMLLLVRMHLFIQAASYLHGFLKSLSKQVFTDWYFLK